MFNKIKVNIPSPLLNHLHYVDPSLSEARNLVIFYQVHIHVNKCNSHEWSFFVEFIKRIGENRFYAWLGNEFNKFKNTRARVLDSI